MPDDRYQVNVTALNLRSAPVVNPKNRVDVLPERHAVIKIAEVSGGWSEIQTIRHGVTVRGFVASEYLCPIHNGHEGVPEGHSGIAAVHLTPRNPVRRNQTSGRAYPLSEDGMPRRSWTEMTDKVKRIGEIIQWLAVEKSARYLRVGATTFCNIYAYDYAYLCGAYVPRVWWNDRALMELASGGSVVPQYDVTVREMNANMLTDWFEDYGELFEWRREYDATELQNAANRGEVCLIVAQRTEMNQPGHICAVVPETANEKAKRRNGNVIVPLQSQAGGENYRYGTVEWWTHVRYRKWGMWRRG